MIAVGQTPFDWFSEIPGAAGYLFEVVFAASRSRSSGARWPSGRSCRSTSSSGVIFTLIYSVTSHWIWSPHGWLFKHGMQDFAGSTVVHYQGALAAPRRRAAARAADRQVRHGRPGEPDPGPQHPLRVARRRSSSGSAGSASTRARRSSVDFGGVGYFAYVALTTNLAAAAGALGGIITAWVVLKKPDISMMLNGVIAALVAITAASGFVAPWAAIVIGFVSGVIAVVGVIWVERHRHRRPDRRGRRARHVRHLGHARAAASSPCRCSRRTSPPARAASFYTRRASTSSACRRSASPSSGVDVLGVVRVLWVMKTLWGIRVRRGGREAGLDVSEHGMWGYPEFYIPVPGGYGTESHSHLGGAGQVGSRPEPPTHAPPAGGRGRLAAHGAAGWSGCGRSTPRPAGDGGQQDHGRAVARPRCRGPSSRRTSEPSMKTFRNCGSSSPSKMRLAQRRVRRDQALEHLAHRRAGDLDLAVAAGLGAQDRGDADGRHRSNPNEQLRRHRRVRGAGPRAGRSRASSGKTHRQTAASAIVSDAAERRPPARRRAAPRRRRTRTRRARSRR